jgi:hypothetical protein
MPIRKHLTNDRKTVRVHLETRGSDAPVYEIRVLEPVPI